MFQDMSSILIGNIFQQAIKWVAGEMKSNAAESSAFMESFDNSDWLDLWNIRHRQIDILVSYKSY